MTSTLLNLNHFVQNLLDNCNHLRHLKQLQAFLITSGHAHSHFFAFKLLRYCTLTLANLNYARLIFDHFRSPDIFLYTAMITAYASQPHHHRSAVVFYRDMVCRGSPRPDQFIYPHVLKSCPQVSDSRGTEQVHSQIVRSGFGQHPIVQTALVDSYSRFGSDIGNARQLFDEISERNVVSWTAMISGYARFGQIENAMSLFEEMPERDNFAWNAVISGCAQNGLFYEAISLFTSMLFPSGRGKHRSIRPDKVTVACTLSSCGHGGMLQLGRCIHGYIYRNGLGPDTLTSNALVNMYGKCGSLKEARRVFSDISSKNLSSWNSMINCFALHGKSESAISAFEEMVKCGRGVKPDELTFLGLLNACTHGGLVEKGQFYFELMTSSNGIEPLIAHYGCLIDLLGRAGRFEEAMEIVKGMRIEPDEVIWASLLNGCKIHGRTDLAEFAVRKLVPIDPDVGCYFSTLANLYGESGKWDESRKVRKVLMEQNARKAPGCSWIELDNQVHQFSSADKRHPRSEEIYNLLEGLFGMY